MQDRTAKSAHAWFSYKLYTKPYCTASLEAVVAAVQHVLVRGSVVFLYRSICSA